MREPRRVHASAGFAPPTTIYARTLSAVRTLIASPYAPTIGDPRPLMIDLSEFNNVTVEGVVDYVSVPVIAAMIRIGGSASVRDKKFVYHWNGFKARQLPRSPYTYNWPGWSVDLHIRNFMDSVELWTPGDLGEGPIWVDAECHAEKSKREVSNHTIGYIEALERETGKEVGWYSALWFLNGFMEIQDWMADKLAWWAQWLYNQPREDPGPVVFPSIIPANKRAIHQTGSNGDARLFGGTGRFDPDRWLLSIEAFNQLFNQSTQPPTPPPSNPLAAQVASNTAAIAQILKGARLMNGGSNG